VAVLRRKPVEATPNALESVYRRRHREFLRVATAITGSAELGEDAVQEGLARALSRRSTFRGSGTVEAWLWKVIVNAARNLHDLGKQLEPLPPLIRDQDTQVLDLCPRHPQPNLPRTGCRRESARAPLRPLGGLVFPGRFAGPFDSWAAQSRRDVLKTAGGRKVARGFKSHPRRSTHFEKPWTERSRFWRWPVSKVRPISPSTGD
jgi:hypothetical protein